MALLSEDLMKVYDTKYFARDYVKHFKNKFAMKIRAQTQDPMSRRYSRELAKLQPRNMANILRRDSVLSRLKDCTIPVPLL